MYEDINFIDLHIHTKFSIACSKYGDLYTYSESAKRKGIDYIGTGDIFVKEHLANIEKKLKEIDNGIFIYNNQKFLLAGEISLIYKEFDKTRKVHLLLIFPTMKSVLEIKSLIKHYGKTEINGRPIIKLSVRNFINMIKEKYKNIIIIPAHIWTPHFGIMGSKSGYDSLYESTDNINDFSALETGLSSDIEMNRLYKETENFNLVSFSDAHSPEKLGREATLIKGKKINFEIIKNAFEGNNNALYGTIEFYPEEGKYFAAGHRKCNYFTYKNEKICPVCNKPLTEGVFGRIKELSSGKQIKNSKEVFYSLPIDMLIKEIKKISKTKKSILFLKKEIDSKIPEMILKTFASIDEIENAFDMPIGEFFIKMRNKKLSFVPGYDGIYGKVKEEL